MTTLKLSSKEAAFIRGVIIAQDDKLDVLDDSAKKQKAIKEALKIVTSLKTKLAA